MPDEPGWYPDPKAEANFRFYDGRKWTKSLADEHPQQAERPDDGPVEGGLLGLLGHQPVAPPGDPNAAILRPSAYPEPGAHVPLTAPAWSVGADDPPAEPAAAPRVPTPPPPPPPAPAADEKPPPPPPAPPPPPPA